MKLFLMFHLFLDKVVIMSYSNIALEILLFTLIFSILGIIIEYLLDLFGFAPSDRVSMLLSTFITVAIKVFFFKGISWWLWGGLMLLTLVFAGHRWDLWMTIKKGRWWWHKN